MIIRIFDSGTSNGASPVRYLLSDENHEGQARSEQPVVLAGSPEATIDVIDSIKRKHKYVSGTIAFRDNERPIRKQMMQIIDAFKNTVCPGLDGRHYNSLFVLHVENGVPHIHFVVPGLEFSSKRRLNIHPPGARNIALYESFTRCMNHELGYAQVVPDPIKLALSDFERKTTDGKQDRSNKMFLHTRLVKAVRTGQIANREELCQFLEKDFGVEITRKGADYISVKFPGAEKAKRLRGPLYNEAADYVQILQSAKQASSPQHLTSQIYQQEKSRLQGMTSERKEFFAIAYLQPKKLRSNRSHTLNYQHVRPHPDSKPTTIKNKENHNMKNELAVIKKIIFEALTVARTIRTTRPNLNAFDKPRAIGNIRAIRERMEHGDNAMREHAAMDAIHEVAGALGEIQSDINGAIVDLNHAKTPEQRSRAEERLAKLTAQKNKLLAQLAAAQVRQLNSTSRMKI